ncbi:S-adenosyl-L-methionine-dependent methyltransferase [Ophiobolus disseminans]|uniref:S-adenosyl-L-methionine-dependent methyltransferase n=1 Tax=Ophiobolus disseminans TaxID=1469910 RepID=A0A6A7A3Y1_9PLEO|nr:S-adenosyl-L-methionine-dependent methyltransferase [Ophiobolus disseminans]
MSLYYEAAAILANTENTGGSLKSRLFTKKDLKSTPGQIFALIAEASKWSIVLKDLTPILALLLSHDLLIAKSGVAAPATHVLKLAITRHKARLSAEFTKARIRYGHATLAAFKEAVSNGELEEDENDVKKANRHPRWVRVNTIKTTLDSQLKTTFAGFEKADSLADVLSARGTSKIYFQDPNIPNLLALPSRINLSRSSAYIDGQIIFQDKASCFPACLLDLSSTDGNVIDGCAAPGNKTTHLAAILSDQVGEDQKVFAFERDKVRTVTLRKMVKLAAADSIVSIKGDSDFLAAKPYSDEFAKIGAILLDPSCSGSGIVGRDDGIRIYLPISKPGASNVQSSGKNKKRKRGDETVKAPEPETLDLDLHDSTPEETPVVDKLAERLTTLSNFQLHILTHAMRFPSAQKITYSTCSIHFEENEGVVFQALASSIAKQRGWKILTRQHQVEGMRLWNRRGVWEDDKISTTIDEEQKEEVVDACIRCHKGTDEGTMGFFVAAFVREAVEEPVKVAEGAADHEEGGGFGHDDENNAADKAQTKAAVSKNSKKKKKQKTVAG